MKSIKYLLCALLATAFVGCAGDVAFEPGPEAGEFIEVFFPEQEASFELAPDEATSLQFTIARPESSTEAIEVPVIIESEKDREIFSVAANASFAANETEATVTVNFPDLAVGVASKFVLLVDDANFSSPYSSAATFLSVEVIRVKWNRILGAKGEEYATIVGNVPGSPFGASYGVLDEVIVEERDDVKGLYRLSNVFGQMCVNFFGGAYSLEELSDGNVDPSAYFMINATDASKVYVPAQSTTIVMNGDYGEHIIGSYVEEVFGDPECADYGELKDGVITFPVEGIGEALSLYENASFKWWGTMIIALPGYSIPQE